MPLSGRPVFGADDHRVRNPGRAQPGRGPDHRGRRRTGVNNVVRRGCRQRSSQRSISLPQSTSSTWPDEAALSRICFSDRTQEKCQIPSSADPLVHPGVAGMGGVGVPAPEVDPPDGYVALTGQPERGARLHRHRPRVVGRYPPGPAAPLEVDLSSDVPVEPAGRIVEGGPSFGVGAGDRLDEPAGAPEHLVGIELHHPVDVVVPARRCPAFRSSVSASSGSSPVSWKLPGSKIHLPLGVHPVDDGQAVLDGQRPLGPAQPGLVIDHHDAFSDSVDRTDALLEEGGVAE